MSQTAVPVTSPATRRFALAAVPALLACNGGDGQATGFSSTLTTVPPGTSSSGSDTSTSTSSSTGEDSASSAASTSSSSTSAGGIPDFGTPPDGGDGPPLGCKGKVDFVFAVSSSFTMKHHQDELEVSFPGFIATLESEFTDFDYHILVPRPYGLPWGIPGCQGCIDTCPEAPPEYPCGAALETCDTVQGAGITFPVGWDATNERCELVGGHRYITTEEPKLFDAFNCIASVGTSGAGLVAEATVSALGDQLNAPGGCNAGFLRDDALLVVVAIEDTYTLSLGTPKDWTSTLIDAKGGDADAVVLLVISTDVDDPNGLCGYEPSDEHELRTWTELVPHALFGSICASGYADYFATAAAMIKSQCDVFVPQ